MIFLTLIWIHIKVYINSFPYRDSVWKLIWTLIWDHIKVPKSPVKPLPFSPSHSRNSIQLKSINNEHLVFGSNWSTWGQIGQLWAYLVKLWAQWDKQAQIGFPSRASKKQLTSYSSILQYPKAFSALFIYFLHLLQITQ